MTDKQRSLATWITVIVIVLSAVGSVVAQGTTIGVRSKTNKEDINTHIVSDNQIENNQEVKINAVKKTVNQHSVDLAVIPDMQEDIKEIKDDQKESAKTQNLMMGALIRIETKLEEMEKKK